MTNKKSVGQKIICKRFKSIFIEMMPEGNKNILSIV